MKEKMLIKTDRLLITEFDESMIESVHLNSLDEDNRRFVPDEVFETLDEAREAVEFLMSRYRGDEGPFVYPILLNNKEHIGHIQASSTDEGWEIGYHIAKAHAGKGYSTEAVKAFLPVIMEKLKISNIFGICLAENVASQRVLFKCGFDLEYEGLGKYQGEEKAVCKYKFSS